MIKPEIGDKIVNLRDWGNGAKKEDVFTVTTLYSSCFECLNDKHVLCLDYDDEFFPSDWKFHKPKKLKIG